jgi:hypothetical protein
MSQTASASTENTGSFGTRLRNFAIGALFAFVLLAPRLLQLGLSERAWLAFRIVLGISGAALVVLPLSLWNGWMTALAGLLFFITAILLPPAKPDINADDKAVELGAVTVLNGGEYQPGNAQAAAVRLFVGAEHIWALDRLLQPLLVIPAGEISSVHADQREGRWILRICWAGHSAEFSYAGIFAERLARAAEGSIRGVMRPALPVLPKRRAASA